MRPSYRQASTPIKRTSRLRCFPALEHLEDRTLLAWDLSISAAATANVTVVNGNFTANNAGANINVADLLTALNGDFNIVISNGNTGTENGDITWSAGILDFDGIGTGQAFQITADASSNNGDITIGSDVVDGTPGGDSLDIVINARNRLVLNRPINAGSGTVTLNVNTDGAGNQGFTQNANGSITTTNATAAAVAANVNTAGGGSGGVSLGANITTDSGGTIAITTATGGNTTGGAITRTGGTLDVGAGTVTLTTPTAASVTSVGTAISPIRTTAGTVTASAGFNGVFITETNSASSTVTTTGGGGGDIELTCLAGTLTMVGATTTVGGDVTLVSDNMTFTGTVFAGTALVNLQPATVSRPITLGTKPGTSLGLLQTDLNQITAGVLRVGAPTSTGGIQVTADIDDPATWTSLTLRNTGTVTQIAGETLTIQNLTVQGAAGVLLTNAGNAVTFLSGTTAGAVFNFANSIVLTVASLFDGTGIVTNGGDITLTADQMAINFAVNAGIGIVRLQPLTATRPITLGTDVAGTLALTDAELDRVTASILRVGNSGAGSIDVTAAMTVSPNTLSLITGNAVTQAAGGSLTVANLALQAANGIGAAAALTTSVTNLAYSNTTTNAVRINNTGALNIASADTLTVATNDGGVTVLTANSPITFVIDTSSLNTLTVTANENPIPTPNVDNITVNATVTVQSINGDVVFQAGDRIITNVNSIVQATNGAVTFIAGFVDNDADAAMTLAGDITANTTSGVITIELEVSGTAIQTGGAVTGANLLFLGFGTFDLNQAGNDVDTLAADIDGSMAFQDTDALTVGTVGGAIGISTVNGAVTLTAGGLLTIVQSISAGSGTVTLSAAGVDQNGGPITANDLLLLGTGTFDLTQSGNDVNTVAADIDGTLTLIDPNTLTVGVVNLTNGIITINDDVTLTVSGLLTIAADVDVGFGTLVLDASGVDQTGGAIFADELLLLGTGTFSLDQPGNDVGTLAADIDGELTYVEGDALIVGTVNLTNGISTVNDNVTLSANNLTLTGPVFAGTAAVNLQPTTASRPITLGTKPGTSLGLLQSDLNQITAGVLRIGTMSIFGGIQITGDIDDPAGWSSLTLRNIGTITQTPGSSLTVQNLVVQSTIGVTLNDPGNAVNFLSGTTFGSPFTFVNSIDLTIASLLDGTGIVSGGADVTICTGGSLIINFPINAGGSTVRLQVGGSVTQSATGVITAGDLGVNAVGPIDLHTVANQISAEFAAETTTLVSGGFIRFLNGPGFVVGDVSANACFQGATGVTTVMSNITLRNQTGVLTLQSETNAGVGIVRLTSGGAILQGGIGIITASVLGVVANGNVVLDATNVIATSTAPGIFAADSNGGNVVLRDVANLSIGQVGGNPYFAMIEGVQTDGGNLTLNIGMSLYVNADILLGAGLAMLNFNQAVLPNMEAVFNDVRIIAGDARLVGSASGTDALSMFYAAGSTFNIDGNNNPGTTQGTVADSSGLILNGLDFEQIETFNGGSGFDTLNVAVTTAGFTTTLNGRGDSDTFNLGVPGTTLNNLLGPIVIDGGVFDPTDTNTLACGPNSLTLAVGNALNILDQDSADDIYALGAGTFTRNGGISVTFTRVETVNLNAEVGNNTVTITDTNDFTNTTVQVIGAGTNVVTVLATGAQTNTAIIGWTGDDTIDILSTGAGSITIASGGDRNNTFNVGNGSLSAVLGAICIDGGQNDTRGDTTLTVDLDCAPPKSNTVPIGQILSINDQSHGGDSTYYVNPDSVLRVGAGQIFFTNVGTLNVNTGVGNNSVNVITAPQRNTNVMAAGGGANSNNIYVGLSGASSNTTVTGGGGADTIVVANTQPNSVTIAKGQAGNDTLSMNATAAMTGVWLGGGDGNDTLYANMNAAGASSVVLLKGWTGNDVFNVTFNVSGNPGGVIEVDGGPGDDKLNFTNLDALPDPMLNPNPNVPGSGTVTSNGQLVLCYKSIERIPDAAFQVASFLLPTNDPKSGKPDFRIVVTGSKFIGTSEVFKLPFAPVIAQANITSPFGFSAPTVAVGDVNQDTIPDLIVAMGSGFAPLITVFDGGSIFRSGTAQLPARLAQFFAYDSAFPGGVFVAAGNVKGTSGEPHIITGAGRGGGPHAKVFEFVAGTYDDNKFPGGGVTTIRSFFAYDLSFTGGVRVAAGDVYPNGVDEIITGAGPGGTAMVNIFGGAVGSPLLRSFFAYSNFGGGIFVAAGDANNDSVADIMTGPGFGGGPHVKVFNGATINNPTPAVLVSFFAFPSPSVPPSGLFNGNSPSSAGVSGVAFGNTSVTNGTATVGLLVGSGLGQPAELRTFEIVNGTAVPEDDTFFVADPSLLFVPSFGPDVLLAGVNVAGVFI